MRSVSVFLRMACEKILRWNRKLPLKVDTPRAWERVAYEVND
jgi:hypothetical protein